MESLIVCLQVTAKIACWIIPLLIVTYIVMKVLEQKGWFYMGGDE